VEPIEYASGGKGWTDREFRDVLGHFCSGLTVIAAVVDGQPVGMTCQSFFSVSIDPPLVAMCLGKKSRTFPEIQRVGSLAVTVLSDDQQVISDTLSVSSDDKWLGVSWTPGLVTGHPILEGSLAALECDLERVVDAGDHVLVIGRVRHLSCDSSRSPLLFYRGNYRQLS
jgi:3-hydroxy-9,10-secoandrosta-1,3,5(10)-triene-9,17-dione monooxygenase reductase component